MVEATSDFQRARWMRDLERFLPLKSQFILSGNVRDLNILVQAEGQLTPLLLSDALSAELKRAGYHQILFFDQLHGFSSPADGRGEAEALMREVGLTPANGRASAGIDLLSATLERFVELQGEPSALIIDFASRLMARRDGLSAAEHALFTRALILSHKARPRYQREKARFYFNTVFWVVDRENDLPEWLSIGNPMVRSIAIAKPDHHARRAVAPQLMAAMAGIAEALAEAKRAATETFVQETEGLLLNDMKAIVQLGRAEALPFANIGDAVRRYKVGVTEDPWQKINRARIMKAEPIIHESVKGQGHAVTHALDIIKRAITGIGAGKRGGRPRGVAFFAGPTGVGKTALAKAITSLLFNDENAYIRFDMSEFSAEHADQRLIGAPPGYLGFDAGGELTNAVREKPFSVILFDEIEKAHPRILDKFLQILDEGVLTSGRGDRVYFSEAFIIFTSNLGIYKRNNAEGRIANVSADQDFETVRRTVLEEIKAYFKFEIGRPEILNRIGENIIVFDFIRDDVAREIFHQLIRQSMEALAEQDIHIQVADAALTQLQLLCVSDLSNGGRGIRNQLEIHLINPLARALFAAGAAPGSRFIVSAVHEGAVTSLDLGAAG
jgi:ATP-dependent Clp protease ATP-binding subunit ClpA